MKKLLIYIFIITFHQTIESQIDHDKAHRRYWYYRTRLINDFMKIGKQQGDCIVFAERNYNNMNESKVGPDQIDLINQYIMVLCLEYKLLSRNNQDCSETIYELYHLLYMINRLDLEAELFWDSTPPTNDKINTGSNLNGFMLREDMYFQYLIENFNDFNYESKLGIQSNKGFTGIKNTNGISYKENKFVGYFNNPINDNRNALSMPHDKYHSMLIAMMFIVKYIPDNTNYNNEYFQDWQKDIKQEAKNIANRIYTYLHGHSGDWSLKYRDSNNSDKGTLSVGENAWTYSYPLSRMACNVHSEYPFNKSETYCSTNNYYDALALSSGRLTYNTFAASAGISEDDGVFRAWDAAGSNLSPSAGFFSSGFIPIFQAMQVNTNKWNLEWAELLRKVLHQDGALLRQMSTFYDPISTAPCNGPYNFSDYNACNYAAYDWSSQDRLEHPKAISAMCPYNSNGSIFPGYYPGIDYMLLHNLYYEYQNQLGDGNNGNNGNMFSNFMGNVMTIIYNASSTVGNVVSTTFCNIANSFVNAITGGGSIPCSSNNNTGNGGYASNVPTTSYFAYNLMDNKDKNIWPRTLGLNTNFVQGTTSNPGKVSVFQNLISEAHIFASQSPAAPNNNIPSKVIYRAGKEITLTTGFSADFGCEFSAYIQRYLCQSNSDPLTMRLVGDSTVTDSLNSNYETDRFNIIPIHYVENPKSNSDLYPFSDSTSQNSKLISETNFNYSDTNKIQNKFSIKLIILPNPNNGQFSILTGPGSESEFATIGIYDSKGQMILQYDDVHNKNKIEVDLGDAAKGIYLIKYSSKNGFLETKRVSIQ